MPRAEVAKGDPKRAKGSPGRSASGPRSARKAATNKPAASGNKLGSGRPAPARKPGPVKPSTSKGRAGKPTPGRPVGGRSVGGRSGAGRGVVGAAPAARETVKAAREKGSSVKTRGTQVAQAKVAQAKVAQAKAAMPKGGPAGGTPAGGRTGTAKSTPQRGETTVARKPESNGAGAGKSQSRAVRAPESTRGKSAPSGVTTSKARSGSKSARAPQGELPSAQPRQDRLPRTHGRREREGFARAHAEGREEESHLGRSPFRGESRKGELRPREVKAQPLSKKDLEFFTELLRSELTRLANDLGKLENSVLKRTQRDASGDLSAYSIHMADLGTDAMEREKDLHLASAEGKRVGEILEALRKIERGVFGECERCGGPVGRKRLEAVPHAPFCLSCQERMERGS